MKKYFNLNNSPKTEETEAAICDGKNSTEKKYIYNIEHSVNTA